MTNSTRLRHLALLGVTISSVACMGAGDGAAPQRTLAALKERDARHHDFSTATADIAGLRDDTASYSDEMGKLIGDMREACDKMMGSGMMGGSSTGSMHDSMRGTMDRMMAAVRDHASRMSDMGDIDTMRKECDEHHKAMAGMLDGMGGMMGGMTGGHMGGMM